MAQNSFQILSNLSSIFLITLVILNVQYVCSSAVKGVSLSKLSFYTPGEDFTCLDGSKTIPFSNVNDDYCDCADGTDEPGTSACRGGHFHCTNAGHRPLNIPSSRVNDMICDCCDGTDEYDGNVQCENTCKELGKEERTRREQEREAALEGVKIKEEYTKQGKAVKAEKQDQLSSLQETLQGHKQTLEALKVAKEAVEEPERLAKEKHEKQWQEEKSLREAEKNRVQAAEAFILMDENKDGKIDFNEVKSNSFLSKDLNDAEWKDYFGEKTEANEQHFTEAWFQLSALYAPKGRETVQPDADLPPTQEQPPPNNGDEPPLEPPAELPPIENPQDVDDNDDGDGDNEDGEALGDVAQQLENAGGSEEETMPDYDDDTKQLIAAADEARRQFDDAQKQHDDAERQMKDVEKLLGYDFGDHEEFYPLHGQCYEYTDREYTYKLCPFDKASQESKSGGSSTSLGTWDGWHGTPSKYSQMHFKDGQNCWNGPNRSVKVFLNCGTSNQVVSVDEPNKCEYVMRFTTPALCHEDMHRTHEEL